MALKINLSLVALSILLLVGCGNHKPEPIVVNKDICSFCEMTISDSRFAAEILTKKGRAYKFDDLQCMLRFSIENTKISIQSMYVNDYLGDNVLLETTNAFYVKHENLKSPMRGNYAALSTQVLATDLAKQFQTKTLTWAEIIKQP